MIADIAQSRDYWATGRATGITCIARRALAGDFEHDFRQRVPCAAFAALALPLAVGSAALAADVSGFGFGHAESGCAEQGAYSNRMLIAGIETGTIELPKHTVTPSWRHQLTGIRKAAIPESSVRDCNPP